MSNQSTAHRVLCEAHSGPHDSTDSCVWPHEVRPDGPTWADGVYEEVVAWPQVDAR